MDFDELPHPIQAHLLDAHRSLGKGLYWDDRDRVHAGLQFALEALASSLPQDDSFVAHLKYGLDTMSGFLALYEGNHEQPRVAEVMRRVIDEHLAQSGDPRRALDALNSITRNWIDKSGVSFLPEAKAFRNTFQEYLQHAGR